MSRKLIRAGLFSPSTVRNFTHDGVKWVTDSYVIARADICSTTITRDADEIDTPEYAAMRLSATADFVPLSEYGPDGDGAVEIGTVHRRVKHDERIWEAWINAGAAPGLELHDGAAVVAWMRGDSFVGLTACRRWRP